MDEKKTKVTELGLVTVRTLGQRDAVYFTRSKLLLFRVECRRANFSMLWLSPRAAELKDGELRQVTEVYVAWKRQQLPDFRLKDYHGHLKSGLMHPWGRQVGKRRVKLPEDEDEFPEQ